MGKKEELLLRESVEFLKNQKRRLTDWVGDESTGFPSGEPRPSKECIVPVQDSEREPEVQPNIYR